MFDLKHGLLASCAAFGLLVGSAAAEDYAPFDKAGFYAAVFGGVNILQDADVSVDPMSSEIRSTSGDVEYDTGFVLGAAVGHEFSHNIRGELELSYRRNDVSSYYEGSPESGGAFNQAGSDDHVSALAVMANVWRDVDLNETFGMHFGGGVGVAQLHVELDDIDSTGGGEVGRVDDSDWVLAGQAGVGFSMMLPQGWIATVDYRAFLTADGAFEGRDVNGDAFEIEHDYLAHSIMVGLRMPFSGY